MLPPEFAELPGKVTSVSVAPALSLEMAVPVVVAELHMPPPTSAELAMKATSVSVAVALLEKPPQRKAALLRVKVTSLRMVARRPLRMPREPPDDSLPVTI